MQRASGTVRRILDLLSAFAAHDKELTIQEISQCIGVSTETAERYVAELTSCQYLVQVNSGYRLGWALLPLSCAVANSSRIRMAGVRALCHLSDVTQLNANLGVAFRGSVMYVGRAEAPLWRSFQHNIGRLAPMHCTGMGKAFLAFNQPQSLPENLTRYTRHTIVTHSELSTALEAVRESGFAMDDAEWIDGIRCLATPVRDQTSRVIAAVSVSGPSSQLDLSSETLILAVRSAAFEIQAQLGFKS